MKKTNEMVERVARALITPPQQRHYSMICEREGVNEGDNPLWWNFVADARNAIAAMREPTEEMVDAAFDVGWQPNIPDVGYDEVWRAMVDAALAD